MTVLAIGAHPDDIELGAGGALIKHSRNGEDVRIIIITNGEKGGAEPGVRKLEAKKSAELINARSVDFLEMEDTNVQCNNILINEIEKLVNQYHPRRVYIHTEKDVHQDHRNAALASITATRNCKEVLAFESPRTFASFSPNFYVVLDDDVIEQKNRCINCFKSQIEKTYMKRDAFLGLTKFRGYQVMASYAEAFESIRIID